MMYGQMTAGSWIYIGTQGILQGTYPDLCRSGRPSIRRVSGGNDHLRPDSVAWAEPSHSQSP